MVSSARIPNESYAQRAKKASASSTSRTTQQKQQQPASHAVSTPPSSLKPPRVNVWAERIKEQQANVAPQPAQTPRQRATSSPHPPRDDAIQPRSPPAGLSAQLAILDQQDEHDPFVVRVPPHLSRQSSSSTNPLPATDPSAWPHLSSADPHSNTSSIGHDSPFLSAVPSRQNSTASFRHHAYSPSGSVRLSRVQSSLSPPSHSASQSRAHSRSGSSASSPRLQIRGRTLPQDDPLPPDIRLDNQHRRSSNKRSSPAPPEPPNHISSSFQIDSVHPPDPPYYRHPLVPPSQDMPPRYSHNFVPQYALPPQFTPAHVPGHTSPPYIPPHSGQGTPPYHHYPPYPAYMYGHPSLFWGDILPHNHFQNQPPIPSTHVNASEHAVSHKVEFGSTSPSITAESGASKHPEQGQNGWQPRPSKSVVFGTINLAECQDDPSAPPPNEGQRTDTVVEHATEQFATFSIGVKPDEPGPSRLASRKSSVRSLSRTLSSQPTINDGAKDAEDANVTPPPSREVNGINKPIKWEFGTTLSEDFDEPRPLSSPPPTSLPPLNHQSESGTENVDDQSDLINVSPSHDASRVDRSMSEMGSPASDVWVVKDYGYGFGDHSGCGNAPDVVRWEMREREKERVREGRREREMIMDQYRDRAWEPARQPGWRHENGVEEGREGWEQQTHVDTPRHMRPRRGSFSGYGGHERGGFAARRGRGFGGRFHGGRARGGFFHHQRPGSYPYVPPPPPPPPFEVLPPAIDMVNEYGQPPYAPPELESYEAVHPVPQPRIPFTSATYSVDAMRNCLLGQLEYYLSPQNMAQDLYLRQRMDNEGWIPISLLASFKRVRQLQTDVDIVREVLSQSGMVEVSRDWVRMGGRQWEVYVLPTAPRSVVTGIDRGEDKNPWPSRHRDGDAHTELGEIEGEHGETVGDCDGEDCEGDDEDDDIEFVIGEEAEGSWMPVPERKQ
ncbi:hypothetical protein J3R83DRAFT_10605 [Lanmaoa asiatica]|nr:hypothetical protein J3R83DRAFT_10605 [Lanmaoa asiatica]